MCPGRGTAFPLRSAEVNTFLENSMVLPWASKSEKLLTGGLGYGESSTRRKRSCSGSAHTVPWATVGKTLNFNLPYQMCLESSIHTYSWGRLK